MTGYVSDIFYHDLRVNSANTVTTVGSAAGTILLFTIPAIGGPVIAIQLICSATT